jgi:hypothetical protein
MPKTSDKAQVVEWLYNFPSEGFCQVHLFKYFNLQPCFRKKGISGLIDDQTFFGNEYAGLRYVYNSERGALKINMFAVY